MQVKYQVTLEGWEGPCLVVLAGWSQKKVRALTSGEAEAVEEARHFFDSGDDENQMRVDAFRAGWQVGTGRYAWPPEGEEGG